MQRTQWSGGKAPFHGCLWLDLVKVLHNMPLLSVEEYKNKCHSEKNNDVI